MVLTEFNKELHENNIRAEEREEGRAEGRAEGIAEGIVEGIVEGQKITLCQNIHSIMEKMNISFDAACDLLNVPVDSRNEYR